MELWIVWLIIVFFLIILEVCTVNLVSIWFIVSGIAALITSFITDIFLIQFAVFVLFGVVLLLTTRNFLKKYIKSNNEKTNLDRVIGKIAVVTEPIKKNEVGEVKVDGKRWSAISKLEFEIDDEVIIDSIEGVKLIVRKKEC